MSLVLGYVKLDLLLEHGGTTLKVVLNVALGFRREVGSRDRGADLKAICKELIAEVLQYALIHLPR